MASFRQTPICLYVCGPPKIGKSHLIIRLSSTFNKALFKTKNSTFCVTTTTEHWDGYKQQPIVVFDDHYKLNDAKQELDASMVFNAVSCTTFYPSFARLELKGLQFTSELIIVTSNIGFPQTVYLPGALHRRHKHHVIVLLNSDNFNNEFDHLTFYYAKEVIDPWQGNYRFPYTQQRDIPYTIREFETNFPHRHLYVKVTLQDLINIVVCDILKERSIFSNLISDTE